MAALRRVLGADPALRAALSGPDPLRIEPVPAVVWRGRVTLWWVAFGPLASPTLRYVALWSDPQGDVDGATLTGDVQAFESATQMSLGPLPERSAVLDASWARPLGLLFLETTRPMDCAVSLLTPESAVEDGRRRLITDLIFTDPRSARERGDLLIRLARLGPEAPPSVVGDLLHGATGALPAHVLPAFGLDADERHQLDRSLNDRLRALQRQTGARLGEAWPSLPIEHVARSEATAPFGATSVPLEDRRSAVETFLERRESPRVQPMGDRLRFQALVALDERIGLLEVTFWQDGRLRPVWTPLSR